MGQSDELSAGVAQHAYAPPPGATELIVVRHGASANAEPGKPFAMLDGRGDPPLSPAGLAQAERVAERLAGEPFERLFVTPLCRTAQTAAPLAAARGIEPEVLPELVEVGLGDWSDGTYRIKMAEGDELVRRVHAEERWELLPGAEPADEFGARVEAGMALAAERTGPDRIAVVVTHGGVIAELCRLATGCSPFAFVHADNCSITRMVLRPDGRWLVRSFNDTNHLG